MDNFRRNNLMVVQNDKGKSASGTWQVIQISVSGTDVWRRALIPCKYTIKDLHILIQAGMDWKNSYRYRFYCENSEGGEKQYLHDNVQLGDIGCQGITDLMYEYGTKWNIKIIVMSSFDPENGEIVRFVAGAGAAPPEVIGGPLRFRRILNVLESGNAMEKQAALYELGPDFVPGLFDREKCNQNLNSGFSGNA
jgi:hypothetical protein